MDHIIVLAQLDRLAKRDAGKPDGLTAEITIRWINAEVARGQGDAAANDPLIAGLIAKARLATDCGWSPEWALAQQSKQSQDISTSMCF